MNTYVAQWEVRGLPGVKILPAGMKITIEEKLVGRLVASGALKPAPVELDPITGEPLDIGAMTKAQLIEYAADRLHLTLGSSRTREDLLATINAAAAAAMAPAQTSEP